MGQSPVKRARAWMLAPSALGLVQHSDLGQVLELGHASVSTAVVQLPVWLLGVSTRNCGTWFFSFYNQEHFEMCLTKKK